MDGRVDSSLHHSISNNSNNRFKRYIIALNMYNSEFKVILIDIL